MSHQSPPHIGLTNDDGPRSIALAAFIEELKPRYKLTVAIPNVPRSGISKAMSFFNPMRFMEGSIISGEPTMETTGTPSDIVTWFRTFHPKMDLIVSGPNLGLNASMHSILTSGTVGAAIEAALWGFPALAFSIETPESSWFLPTEKSINVEEAAKRARLLIQHTLDNGLPPGVNILNVNFPENLDETTPTRVTDTIPIRFNNRVTPRTDTHGNEYFWIIGEPIKKIPKTSDVFISAFKKEVSITPIQLELTNQKIIETTRKFLDPLFK
jgi:5'-nucleotidase